MASATVKTTTRFPKEQEKAGNRIAPLQLALFGIALFTCFAALPLVLSNARLLASFGGAAVALLILLFIVRRNALQAGRTLRYEFLPRPVHYVQMLMHSSIYAYWGWYWPEVYHYYPLIIAQVVFVYVLDMLVTWSRRDNWILGFGPVPIVFSTNLFLWFKDDWFYFQFMLIATGVLCKEFVTWTRDGRRAHIFNPSAIALCIFSIGLIVTGTTYITWGEEVAVTLGKPPYIYVEIFVIGLIVQALFSVTLVTLSAAAMLYLLNLAYTHSTGLYYFVDTNIPAAVFLGLHLLVTDPATSPKKNIGKVIFGAMYGAAVFGMYTLLGRLGVPTFYDKLLCVPPLNLTVQALDRFAVWAWARIERIRLQPFASLRGLNPRQLNYAHMGIWIPLFIVMAATGFLGGRHPGADPEFWQRACAAGKNDACQTWAQMLGIGCGHGSARSCVTLALLLDQGRVVPRDTLEAAKNFGRACDLGESLGCRGVIELVRRDGPSGFERKCGQKDGESCFMLASLYYTGHGVARDDARAFALFHQACEDGWQRGCAGLAECYRSGRGTPVDSVQALAHFDKACQSGVVASCFSAASLYRNRNNPVLADQRFQDGCALRRRNEQTNAAYFAAQATGNTGSPNGCPE